MEPLTSLALAATVVDEGHRHRLKFDCQAAYMRFVNALGVGSAVIVTIEEERAHRSKTWEQVKYWKAVPCVLVAEHCGMTEKQADLAMLGEKYGYITGPGGHQIPSVTTIKGFTVEEMSELIAWMLDWAPAELEIIVPPPDKNWKQAAERIRKERRGRRAA